MPIARKEFDQLLELGSTGIKEIIELEKKLLGSG
jgi:ribonuclease PH